VRNSLLAAFTNRKYKETHIKGTFSRKSEYSLHLL
jgi:hypothetical protein